MPTYQRGLSHPRRTVHECDAASFPREVGELCQFFLPSEEGVWGRRKFTRKQGYLLGLPPKANLTRLGNAIRKLSALAIAHKSTELREEPVLHEPT